MALHVAYFSYKMVDGVQVIWSLFTTALLFPWQLVVAEGQVNYLSLYNSQVGAAVVDGSITVEPFTDFKVFVFGKNLNSSSISFSKEGKKRGDSCGDDRVTIPKVLTTEDDESSRSILSLNFQASFSPLKSV